MGAAKSFGAYSSYLEDHVAFFLKSLGRFSVKSHS
jgi:hypothetical protein